MSKKRCIKQIVVRRFEYEQVSIEFLEDDEPSYNTRYEPPSRPVNPKQIAMTQSTWTSGQKSKPLLLPAKANSNQTEPRD